MELILTHEGSARRITGLCPSWTWSGDKSTLVRQLAGTIVYDETRELPVVQLGDTITMRGGGDDLFEGIVLRRSLGSEDKTMSFTCFDRGIYCRRNDGTYKFRAAAPEDITRQVCADKGIAVAALPESGVRVSRKFSGVALDKIIATAWTLAAQQNGKTYAILFTPGGLRVSERGVSAESPVLKAAGSLMDAKTTEDATNLVSSVAIYDAAGNFCRRTGDEAAQKLFGTMERHLKENASGDVDTDAEARELLDSGGVQRTVTVDVLGDLSLITGQTVIVREARTGLQGIFWIDADAHTWKRGNYYCRLTLNCRNVTAETVAGGELK